MEFQNIEFDEAKLKSSLTRREKILIYILGIILMIIGSAKYSHQVKSFIDTILEDS